jgi:N-(5-amino-5-carboxypentanoyl)-L-cysteinyl-D-valine synthase
VYKSPSGVLLCRSGLAGGTIVSGRNLPIDNLESTVGLCINTLPLIVDHSHRKTRSILDAIRDIQMDLIDMNCRRIVELGKIGSGELMHGLFDSLFVLENYPVLDRVRTARHSRELNFEVDHSSKKNWTTPWL